MEGCEKTTRGCDPFDCIVFFHPVVQRGPLLVPRRRALCHARVHLHLLSAPVKPPQPLPLSLSPSFFLVFVTHPDSPCRRAAPPSPWCRGVLRPLRAPTVHNLYPAAARPKREYISHSSNLPHSSASEPLRHWTTGCSSAPAPARGRRRHGRRSARPGAASTGGRRAHGARRHRRLAPPRAAAPPLGSRPNQRRENDGRGLFPGQQRTRRPEDSLFVLF